MTPAVSRLVEILSRGCDRRNSRPPCTPLTGCGSDSRPARGSACAESFASTRGYTVAFPSVLFLLTRRLEPLEQCFPLAGRGPADDAARDVHAPARADL